MRKFNVVPAVWLLVASALGACEGREHYEVSEHHKVARDAAVPPEASSAEPAEPEPEENVGLVGLPTAFPQPTPAPMEASSPAPETKAPEPPPPAPPPVQTPTPPPVVAAPPTWKLAGSVSTEVASAARSQAGLRVEFAAIAESGLLESASAAGVNSDGHFELTLPLTLQPRLALAQVVDAAGNVFGSTLVSVATAAKDDVRELAPITLESSLEADVLVSALRCPCSEAKRPAAVSLALDVAVLVDASLGTAVQGRVAAGGSRTSMVAALAEAGVAATRGRQAVLAEAELALDAVALLAAHQEALQLHNLALCQADAGAARDAADGALIAALDLGLSSAGASSADLRARSHVAASLAFTSSLQSAWSTTTGLNAALFPALRAAAKLEAHVTASAVVSLLESGNVGPAAVAAAVAAGATLNSEVHAAVDVRALKAARAKYIEAVCGRPSSSGGLLGGLLTSTTGLLGTLTDALLGKVLGLSVDLEEKLALDVAAIAKIEACASLEAALSLDASLAKLALTLAQFAREVQKEARSTGGAESAALAKVLATAQLLLRASL